MRYADVLVGVEYELSDPRGPAPTFEFIQGRLPVLDLGTPWIVIGKQDGWVRVRATYDSLDPRTTVGSLVRELGLGANIGGEWWGDREVPDVRSRLRHRRLGVRRRQDMGIVPV